MFKGDESLQIVLAGFASDAGLPVMAGFSVEAGEPTTAADVGVDADGVSEVERDVGFLGGVATDHDLAGLVGLGSAEFLVNDGKGELLVNRGVWLKVGVNEDVGLGLVVGLVAEEEVPVGFGDVIEAAGAVGFQGGSAAPGFEPVCEIRVVDAGEEEFFFVVAGEGSDFESLFKVDDEGDDAFGIGASINVVADEDEMVIGLWGDDIDE